MKTGFFALAFAFVLPSISAQDATSAPDPSGAAVELTQCMVTTDGTGYELHNLTSPTAGHSYVYLEDAGWLGVSIDTDFDNTYMVLNITTSGYYGLADIAAHITTDLSTIPQNMSYTDDFFPDWEQFTYQTDAMNTSSVYEWRLVIPDNEITKGTNGGCGPLYLVFYAYVADFCDCLDYGGNNDGVTTVDDIWEGTDHAAWGNEFENREDRGMGWWSYIELDIDDQCCATASTPNPTQAPTRLSFTPPTGSTSSPTPAPTRLSFTPPTGSTSSPTLAPTPPIVRTPPRDFTVSPTSGPTYVTGDPHFQTWDGGKYDFNGVCDMILLSAPGFDNGKGLELHIRTKKMMQWSYVASATLKIGDDIIEVIGGQGVKDHYYINGEALAPLESGFAGGLEIEFTVPSTRQRQMVVNLDKEGIQKVQFQSFKDFLRVDILGATEKDFDSSLGLMGQWETGAHLGRDGKTPFLDDEEFGQEWQIRKKEPMLFHKAEGPQSPRKCRLPKKTDTARRRLGEATITLDDAERACARVSENERDSCVFDVLATNDKEFAGAY